MFHVIVLVEGEQDISKQTNETIVLFVLLALLNLDFYMISSYFYRAPVITLCYLLPLLVTPAYHPGTEGGAAV